MIRSHVQEQNPCLPNSTALCYKCAAPPIDPNGGGIDNRNRCRDFCKGEGTTYRCNRYISKKSPFRTCWGHNPFVGVNIEVIKKVRDFTITSFATFDEKEFKEWVNLPTTEFKETDAESYWNNMTGTWPDQGVSANQLTLKFGVVANMSQGNTHNMDLELRFHRLWINNESGWMMFDSPVFSIVLDESKIELWRGVRIDFKLNPGIYKQVSEFRTMVRRHVQDRVSAEEGMADGSSDEDMEEGSE